MQVARPPPRQQHHPPALSQARWRATTTIATPLADYRCTLPAPPTGPRPWPRAAPSLAPASDLTAPVCSRTGRCRRCSFFLRFGRRSPLGRVWHPVGVALPPRAVALPVWSCPGAGPRSLTEFPCVWNVREGVRAIMSGPATPARLRLMSDLKAMMQEPPEVRWCAVTFVCARGFLSPLQQSVPLSCAVWVGLGILCMTSSVGVLSPLGVSLLCPFWASYSVRPWRPPNVV